MGKQYNYLNDFKKNHMKPKHKEPERKTHDDTNVELVCWASLLVAMKNGNIALEGRLAAFANEWEFPTVLSMVFWMKSHPVVTGIWILGP